MPFGWFVKLKLARAQGTDEADSLLQARKANYVILKEVESTTLWASREVTMVCLNDNVCQAVLLSYIDNDLRGVKLVGTTAAGYKITKFSYRYAAMFGEF